MHHEKGDRERSTDSKMSHPPVEEDPLLDSKEEPISTTKKADKKAKDTHLPLPDMMRQASTGEREDKAKSTRTTSFSFKHQEDDRRLANPSHFHELCEGHAGYYGFRMVTSHIDKETHESVRKETMLYALSQQSRATWVRLLRKAAHNVSITKYYSIGKRIGKGKFGTVYQGTHYKTGEIVAIKAMDKSRVTQKDLEGLRAEIAILKLLVHPCVIHMRHIFESERYIYIVMDLHPAGDLGHKLLAVNQFPQSICRSVCHKLLETLQYLHQRGIVHRDIKPENIMLKDPNDFTQIVLIDFGLSKFAIPNEKMAETIGTIDYLAPEIFSKNYGFAVDNWALGVLLYAMLSGLLPFWGETLQAQRRSIETQDPDFSAPEWKGISNDAIDLIKGLLQKDPKKRLTIDEALKHRWFMEPVPQQQKSVVMHLPSVGEPPFSALPPAAAPSNKDVPRASRSTSSQETELPSPSTVLSRSQSLNTPETVIATARESKASDAKVEAKADAKVAEGKEDTVKAATTVMEVAKGDATETAKKMEAEALPEVAAETKRPQQ